MNELKEDPRPTSELVREALSIAQAREQDDTRYWNVIRILHHRVSETVFEAAHKLSNQKSSMERILAANILGQSLVAKKLSTERAGDILMQMLSNEQDEEVLEAIAFAFGHLRDPRAVPMLVGFAKHPNDSVRFAVVSGISCQEDPLAVQTLIELSSDKNGDIRNWATFGLGSLIDSDTPKIRAALIARLEDPYEETSDEALVGLAIRKDGRIVKRIVERLRIGDFVPLLFEAAEALNHPDVQKELERTKPS